MNRISQAALLSVVVALAACGGKGSAANTTPPTGADPAATPFDKDQTRTALAAMAVPDACGGTEEAATLGALFDLRSGQLGPADTVDVDFACRAADAGTGQWECTWSVFTKPAAPSPDDPCAEGGSSGFQIITTVDSAGAIADGSVVCNAPG